MRDVASLKLLEVTVKKFLVNSRLTLYLGPQGQVTNPNERLSY